ncbi:hypothetical protein FXO37_23559 [Capsicum annuum]|nr:hypothetical protein FXO37_23559 [Capsicum annuum]
MKKTDSLKEQKTKKYEKKRKAKEIEEVSKDDDDDVQNSSAKESEEDIEDEVFYVFVVIPRLHFDLVDSGRYKNFSWGTLSFEDLARSLNNRLKAGEKFYLIYGLLLAIQVWLYKCCSNVPRKIASKVDNRILRLLNWKTNAPRPRFEYLMDVMFNDDGKSKLQSPAKEEAMSKQESHVEEEVDTSKKFFDDFHNKEQFAHKQTEQPNVDDGGLEKSGQL